MTGAFLGGHVLAISSSGQVWSWGSNSHGQLGLGVVDDFVHHPEKAFEAAGTSKMVGAACGKFHSVVWSDDGVLYSCGDNSQGACSHPRNQKKVIHSCIHVSRNAKSASRTLFKFCFILCLSLSSVLSDEVRSITFPSSPIPNDGIKSSSDCPGECASYVSITRCLQKLTFWICSYLQLPVFLAVELPGLNVLHAACADANTIICTEIGHVWVVGDNSRSQCGPLAATSQNCFKFAWIDPKTSWNAPNRTRARDSHIVEKEVKVRGCCMPR